MPPQAGGSTNLDTCLNQDLLTGAVPASRISTTSIAIGERLTTCYYHLTGSTITETVTAPDGTVIRQVSFLAEALVQQGPVPVPPIDVDGTDYMPLPGDPPGTYTITAQTVQGTFTETFAVVDGLSSPGGDTPFVVPRGRGTGEAAPSLLQDGYLFFSGFAPAEAVIFSFWYACHSEATRQRGLLGANFVSSGSITVNRDGQAFMRVPPEIGAELQQSPQYVVGAHGTVTPRPHGGPGWLEGARFSAYHGNAFGARQSALVPLCDASAASGASLQYRTIVTYDGFVAVRAEATTQSAEIARLVPDTLVICQDIVLGEELAGSREWAYCPEAGGYLFLALLEPLPDP